MRRPAARHAIAIPTIAPVLRVFGDILLEKLEAPSDGCVVEDVTGEDAAARRSSQSVCRIKSRLVDLQEVSPASG